VLYYSGFWLLASGLLYIAFLLSNCHEGGRMFSRRQVLAATGAASILSVIRPSTLAPAAPQSEKTPAPAKAFVRMGGTPTAFAIHFRQKLEKYNMHLICDPRLPRQDSDVAAFETQIKAFKDAGSVACHAALTGRRYEDYTTFEPFKQMFEQCKKSVELAEPILRKYKMRLGIENHKGWRSAEQANWLKQLGSEWVGVCFDFGNNISLCEEPMETARTLAPYTVFAHIKDMAVEEYEDGFLLSEVPMGEGILDLKQMVQMLRKVDPGMIFDLEMITRDSLKIPVFTSKYWVTFDDSYSPLPARDLAKVLTLVKKNHPKAPLPRITGLSREAQVRLEDEYNSKCIAYARQNLEL
jgi:sugar phosphate isomerase/epimerase